MNVRNFTTVAKRREALEKELAVSLRNIGTYSTDETQVSTRNCENMIGVAQVPMGIAGPVRLNDRTVYLPLATTEGALVASVNRGCKAITQSGGAYTEAYRIGATRGPVYRVETLAQGWQLFDFIRSHMDAMRTIAAGTSSHISLTKAVTRGAGKYRFIRFSFDTQDAMGMNMVTIATERLSAFIEKETGIPCVAVAGNFDTDKKPAWINAIEHRGIEVWAEAVIPSHILESTLKSTAKKIYDVWLAKCMIGSALAGSMGFNAHMANVLSALFIATGQDPAHVAEASTGMTLTEIVNGSDLYVSIYLPDLMVGTVGGGTGLATQKEALSVLGVSGGREGNNAMEFAGIVAGAVLAGEISLLSSLAAGSLGRSHAALGRGGKT